jgi:Tol biopolymer transport system component
MVQGTHDAVLPFWSPDGESLAFFADGKLKRVDLAGGSPQTLADAPRTRGGTWGKNGDIVFMPATAAQGLYRVAAAGGRVTQVTRLSADRQEIEHLYPHFLPDGRRFLYFAGSQEDRHTGLYAASLDGGEPILVASIQSRAEYADGHLIFGRGRDLFAQPIDIDTLTLTGEPLRIGEQVGGTFGSLHGYAFTTAAGGAAAFWSGSQTPVQQLLQVDRSGRIVRRLAEPDRWLSMTLSPDSTRLALERMNEAEKSADVWIMELATASVSRFTSFAGPWRWFGTPLWSRDGRHILVHNFTGAPWVKPANGSGDGERLPHTLDGNGGWPTDWSPDGRYVVVGQNDPQTLEDIWLLPTASEGQLVPYARTAFREYDGRISPDGRWLAWTSNESGRDEVYVDTFPRPSGKTLVSRSGGSRARWRGDGRALYYISGSERLMAVELSLVTDHIGPGSPEELFEPPATRETPNRSDYEVLGNGAGFVFNAEIEHLQPSGITVVLDWPAWLNR